MKVYVLSEEDEDEDTYYVHGVYADEEQARIALLKTKKEYLEGLIEEGEDIEECWNNYSEQFTSVFAIMEFKVEGLTDISNEV